MRLRLSALMIALCLAAGCAIADPVLIVPYDELREELSERVDFERLPRRDEPGFNLDLPLYSKGAWLGESFAGQSVESGPDGHDVVTGTPEGGLLKVDGGAKGQSLSVAFHRGFASNAVFPLGAAGFPRLDARGEGALAVLFDDDQSALGFRMHTDYPDPLGARPAGDGGVQVLFFARDGRLLHRLEHNPGSGITEFGYRRRDGLHDIAGILILNTDPGGIAVDDIIFAMPRLLG